MLRWILSHSSFESTGEFFFQRSPPDWINAVHEDRQNFRPFVSQENWMLERSVGANLRSSQYQIQVLWLLVQYKATFIPKFVAKVFPEYTETDALTQLRRFPPRVPKTLKEAKHELDPYVNEARVYHRIETSCPSSEKIYFPQFHGVITDFGVSNFIPGFINPRAVVLEAVRPKLASRRILATCREDSHGFRNQLSGLGFLSVFEMEYYNSLFHDRIRRLLALHRLGITHGDVRDDHFRLPGDFYDTVLYDLSISYTFSPVTPYLVNFRLPRSLKDISESEQAMVGQHILERSKNIDFRDHLIKSTGITESAIMNALFRPPNDEPLELIILRIRFRPDAFSMPSVNSVFPFLEALRPKDDYTWHIRRGRLLESYEPLWLCSTMDDSGQAAMSFVSDMDCVQNMKGSRCRYLLCLIPKEWGVEGVRSLLMSICLSLPRGSRGCIKTWLELKSYT
ncbi:hypothetical protein BO94DRAFT_565037 [Aspergillus sclerotioniger CBS 115572]|uniref:Protein kinase domain-containing protein n=1 Tax=Aspergillus sclerotioniger CBS 115572 TaxID=1450535 RepID=A0A317WVE0_9EURO|nr:hypothetical protein BO94DRAFT_565037 [Aspergillus sclerotioniger CBS 115572]PWY90384.1 hypothetical protein BO94DRAFT_565037 [Aspergillus sclerotioniger CBS 115572]